MTGTPSKCFDLGHTERVGVVREKNSSIKFLESGGLCQNQ